MKIQIVNCSFCNKEFLASPSRIARGSAKHCSRACADKNRPLVVSKKLTLSCVVCGNNFLIKPSRKDSAQFCSKKCRGIQQTIDYNKKLSCQTHSKKSPIINNIESNNVLHPLKKRKVIPLIKNKIQSQSVNIKEKKFKPKTGTDINCKCCGKSFYVEKHRANTTKCCSIKCAGKIRQNRIICQCLVCNSEFLIVPSRLKRNGGKVCSNQCKSIYLKNGKVTSCNNCQCEIYITNGEYERNQYHFCSLQCRILGMTADKVATWKG